MTPGQRWLLSVQQEEKQIVRVLRAVQAGCDTSKEIAEFIGMPIEHVSTYLHDLVSCGAVKRRKGYTRRYSKRGPACHVYEVPG
jgi:predicted transcriptional regulator